MGQRKIQMEHGELKQMTSWGTGQTRGYNKIYKITKTEMGSPSNENGEYKNYQTNNRMDAI